MNAGDRLTAIIVLAHGDRLGFVFISALLLAGAITLRLSRGRNWSENLLVFAMIAFLLSFTGVALFEWFLDLPVAGLEVVSFRE